jgi:hypothetical protein
VFNDNKKELKTYKHIHIFDEVRIRLQVGFNQLLPIPSYIISFIIFSSYCMQLKQHYKITKCAEEIPYVAASAAGTGDVLSLIS